MRFVHVEDFFHPDAGYQLNLLSRLQAKQGHEVYIVTAEIKKVPAFLTDFFGKDNINDRDEKYFELTGVKIIRVPLLGFYSGRAVFHKKIFAVVNSLNPNAVLVHGEDTLTGIQFIRRVQKLNYPLVLDCHMVEMASMNRFRNIFRYFYKRFVTPYIQKNDIPLIRTVNVDYVEKYYGIPLAKTTWLSFGTDTDYFRSDEKEKHEFRRKYGLNDNDFVVIYAGKLDAYKGGKFLASSIKGRFVTKTKRQIIFIIIGNTVGEYGSEIENIFNESENEIKRFPTQKYWDLKEFYQVADLAIFPKQCSLSFFEVQSCELPVVFEDNEINLQRNKYGNAFAFVSGDMDDFRRKIIECVDMPQDDFHSTKIASRKYVCDNYNFVPIAKKFTDIMVAEAKKFEDRKKIEEGGL
jgi:glycosyltransferase involved in cell wall biosynthesis